MRFPQVLALLIAVALAVPSDVAATEAAAPASTLPSAPPGLAMVANTSHSITLSWGCSPKDDATSYNVYISHTPDGLFAYFATVTERTITHDNLAPGITCFYKVSAIRAESESVLSPAATAFTIAPWEHAPFPARIAKNMCVTLGATIVCDTKPLSGTLSNLTDGSDATSCRLRRACDLKIKLNPDISIADAGYLILTFRTDCGSAEWSNDRQARTLTQYTVIESPDSTNGEDGTWHEIVSGSNNLLDGVIVIPNHKPKWVGIRVAYPRGSEVPKKDDRRLMPNDLILCRLDVFRSAPAGYRNDYWIFTGDSLVVQDMPAGTDATRTAWFSDLIRKRHPDRYPIVVHAARGGEMLKDTLPRTRGILASLSPDNGTATPTATIVCWESGYNDVGVGGSLGVGASLIASYEAARQMCGERGLIMVPVRIEFSTQYLDQKTLAPAKDNIFVNSLAVNLGGVDVFARTSTPYACDPGTQLPYADYWSYTRENHATVLGKDGVHHTKEGMDGVNTLWAEVADKMIYAPQK